MIYVLLNSVVYYQRLEVSLVTRRLSNRRIMLALTVQNGSSLHPHTWMIKTNRLFLKLSAHPSSIMSFRLKQTLVSKIYLRKLRKKNLENEAYYLQWSNLVRMNREKHRNRRKGDKCKRGDKKWCKLKERTFPRPPPVLVVAFKRRGGIRSF